jgi:hydroxymethylbilane synthase
VGTSSVRRSAQLKRLHPHLEFANIRGNVETRLAKLDDPNGEFTCMIMSACGFERIGLGHRLTQYLSSKTGGIYHAVGQGALALEIRKGDAQTLELIQPLADRSSTLVCLAERELMRRLEGGCSVPIGVESDWLDEAGHVLNLRAIVVSLDGLQAVEESLSERVSEVDEAVALGRKLATKLVEAGAGKILDEINVNRPAKT